MLKLWRHIRNPTPSIDANLLEKNPAIFHPDPIWNDGALGFFEGKKKNNNNNKMSSDRRSVPDPQFLCLSCKTNDADLSVTAISYWMSANRLKVNMEKTEYLWTGSRSNLDRLPKSALYNWDLGTTRSTSLTLYGFSEYSSRRIYVSTSTSGHRS